MNTGIECLEKIKAMSPLKIEYVEISPISPKDSEFSQFNQIVNDSTDIQNYLDMDFLENYTLEEMWGDLRFLLFKINVEGEKQGNVILKLYNGSPQIQFFPQTYSQQIDEAVFEGVSDLICSVLFECFHDEDELFLHLNHDNSQHLEEVIFDIGYEELDVHPWENLKKTRVFAFTRIAFESIEN